ncbi:MAG: hypothetical protein C5B59_13645 [Bacteroidetes bacterium]|nr:MAG: hypothetical protein C5B59_13645 [Bacteroidota bacterium]
MRYFPEYLPDPEKERNPIPAVLQNNTIHTSTESWDAQTWKQIRKVIVTNDLTLFVGNLTGEHWLNDARKDSRAKFSDTTEWFKVGVTVGGFRYWIVDTKQWGYKDSSSDFLSFIKEVYSHCLGFSRPTPSSLGKRLMLESWLEHARLHELTKIQDTDWPGEYIPEEYKEPKRRHPLPGKPCRMDLKDNLTGGRVECFSDVLPGYYKLDMDNALVSHYMTHPTGTARRFGEYQLLLPPFMSTSNRLTWNSTSLDSLSRLGATFFGRCIVEIQSELELGCFPFRDSSLTWPTSTGRYESWLWKEQVMDCLHAGCNVWITDGWYWKWMTQDNKAWSEFMIHLRETAPNEEVRKAIKRIASAAISTQGIGDARYFHAPMREYDYDAGDQRLYDSRGPLNVVVKTDRNSTRPTPIHWYAYTWMQVSRTLYRMALPHAQANKLVMLHTDALYIKDEPERIEGWKKELVQ